MLAQYPLLPPHALCPQLRHCMPGGKSKSGGGSKRQTRASAAAQKEPAPREAGQEHGSPEQEVAAA